MTAESAPGPVGSGRVWLVSEQDLNDYTVNTAFTDKADAEAYAVDVQASVEELPLYPAGTAPEVHTIWHGQAQAAADEGSDASPHFWSTRVSALTAAPKDLCGCVESAEQNRNVGGFAIAVRAHGTDRAAVEESVRSRYEQAKQVGQTLFPPRYEPVVGEPQ